MLQTRINKTIRKFRLKGIETLDHQSAKKYAAYLKKHQIKFLWFAKRTKDENLENECIIWHSICAEELNRLKKEFWK